MCRIYVKIRATQGRVATQELEEEAIYAYVYLYRAYKSPATHLFWSLVESATSHTRNSTAMRVSVFPSKLPCSLVQLTLTAELKMLQKSHLAAPP